MELNVKTLYLVGGIVTTCGAGAALLTWYHHRDAPGLRAWAAALLLSGLGALILRSPAAAASVWMTFAANAVIVAGFALLWTSLRQFNETFSATRLLLLTVAIVVAYLAICSVAQSAGAGRNAASMPFSLFLGLLSCGAAYEIWQGRHRDGLTNRLPTTLALVGLGLARLVRAATLALQSAEWLPPGQVAEFHPYTLYATIVFVLATTYGFVLMANEGAVRRDAELFAGR